MELPVWLQRLADQCTEEELARLEQTLGLTSAASSPTSGGWRRDASHACRLAQGAPVSGPAKSG